MTSRLLPLATTIVLFLLAYALCAAQFPAIASTRVLANLLTDDTKRRRRVVATWADQLAAALGVTD